MSNITTTAQDTSLELAVRTQTFMHDLVERMTTRLEENRGQTAAEYMGILLIVGTVIAGLIAIGIPGKVSKAATDALGKMGIK